MEKEDKVAFSVMLAALLGLMLGVKIVGGAIFGWFDAADAGIGFKDALIVAVILSVVLLVVFALVAGDGVIGELPSMLIGFFIMTGFFTLSIAWIF